MTETPIPIQLAARARHADDAHPLGVRRHRGRRIHGAARPLHRQHRLPRDRAELPRQHALLALVGAERLRDRLRGVPRAGRAARRPPRPPQDVPARPDRVRGRIGGMRPGADPRRARCRPCTAGRRRGAAHPHLAGPPAARLPACAAGGGDRRLGRRWRRRRGGRPRPRRRARRGGLEADLPRQHPARRRGADRLVARPRRGSASGGRRPARPCRDCPPDRRHRRGHAGDRGGAAVGLDERDHAGHARRLGPRTRGLPLALQPPPHTGRRAVAAAHAVVCGVERRDAPLRDRLRRNAAPERALPHRRVGVQHTAGRPRDRSRAADGGARLAAGEAPRRPTR